MIVAFTPGFFYASTAFLPSSFAMYTSTLGLTAFMDWRGGAKTAVAIMWFAIGALLGWPFAGALIIPFVLEDWAVVLFTGDWHDTFLRYLDGAVRSLTVLGLQTSIDAFFYRNLTIVPWRLVSYNIFNINDQDRGPDIFGTEPWHFYIRNLLLNFNIWYLLAMSAAPLLLIQALFLKQRTTNQTLLRTVTFITPFYLWFTIFTLQPHKEERFMYPSYPFLALNASISLHMLLSWLGTSNPSTLIGKIPPQFKLALILPLILASITIGLLRIIGTVTSYRAPLQIYEPLQRNASTIKPATTICHGKDWYRFPTSFLIPANARPAFVKSAFDGLLPGSFHEGSELGLFPGTWMVPSGMNDRNREDVGKYIDVGHCSYLVDSVFASADHKRESKVESGSELEPKYIEDEERWEVVKCVPFLDTAATGLVGRLIWLPGFEWVPRQFRRVWGRHCLLKARKGVGG